MEKEEHVKPIWVDSPSAFESMLKVLTAERVIGVDTESNSLHAYREQVCLLQFSTPGQDFLADPLGSMNIQALGELFANEAMMKIFHACEYDILSLRRDFGFNFVNIYDTMQAARILGREKLSLGDLVETEFGVHLDKHNQKADWGLRPLTNSMQTYAALDTHYLIALYQKLSQELNTRGLSGLAMEDFQRLSHSQAGENHKPLYTQVSGYQDLDRQQLAILNELSLFRDRIAQKRNLPLFKVIGNSTLLEIAQRRPRTENELMKLETMPLRLYERYKDGLMNAMRAGMRAAPIDLPQRQRPDGRYLARMDRLKTWRKKKAEEMKVLSDVILPREILEGLAGENPQNTESLNKIMESVPWRKEKFGAEILVILKEKK